MKKKILILFFVASCILLCPGYLKSQENSVPELDLSKLEQIAEVDERYQSVNIEMCEIVGGDFWIPYELLDSEKVKSGGFSALKRTIPPVNLYDKKLRTLAAALGSMYIRVSGTWANTTYFQDNDKPKLKTAPNGYENVLTRNEWKGVIDFCKSIDAKLVTSFAISAGMRDADGNWTPKQIEPLVNYTTSLGGEIAAAEMFNEPSHAGHGGAPEGYNAARYAADFEAFKRFVDTAVPDMKIMGPGSTGEGGIIPGITISTKDILTTSPEPEFEIFTYHFYGGVSKRCMGNLTPENALTNEWLSKTELGLKYYKDARNKYTPDSPIWLTETAEAACGGNPWAATYVDCFRYLEQLGRLAKNGVKVVMHNTLCASEYALLEQDTHEPRPNYWAAFLWGQLMGTKVFDYGQTNLGVDIFVHNLKNSSDGYAVMIVNPKMERNVIQIKDEAEQYLLTSDDILSKTIKLNGVKLKLNADELPEIKGEKISAGEIEIPSQSILFLVFNSI